MEDITTIKYRYSIKTQDGAEVANSSNGLWDTEGEAIQAGLEYREKHLFPEYIVSSIPVEESITSADLYQQVRDYILSVWSKNCITQDTKVALKADNGNQYIYFLQHPGSTPFLRVTNKSGIVRFKGYIRNVGDFKLLLELTSVSTPI
jgi:hypothetical protein